MAISQRQLVEQAPRAGQAKIVSHRPYPVGVRMTERGWEILVPPGPLASMLTGLSRDPGAGNDQRPRQEAIGGRLWQIVPLTDSLDAALVQLADVFIDLRYETGRVQLALFSLEQI